MAIRLVTFKTLQTIIADIDTEVEFDPTAELKVKQPVIVFSQQTPQGPGIAFAPFLDFSDDFSSGIVLDKSAVLTITNPITELYNKYNELFGSGIQIVSSLH